MSYSYYTVEEKALTSFFNKKNAPQNIAKRTATKYGSMPLFELKEKGMWNPRLERIVPYLPKDAWIAGGFLRSMIGEEDELAGDIDFFFHAEDGFNNLLELIKNPSSIRGAEKAFNYYSIPEHEDFKKLRIVDCESLAEFRPNIQLVRMFWFDSPEHVIDSFDFTACQFITDGKTLWFGPHSFEDVKERKLRWHREADDPIARLNRVLKYREKGYKPVADMLELAEQAALKVLNNPDEIAKQFQQEKIETQIHKHPASHLQRAWDYLETAPLTRSAYAKAVKREQSRKSKISIDKRTNYSYDAS